MNCPNCEQRLPYAVAYCPSCGNDVRHYVQAMQETAPDEIWQAPVADTGINHPTYLQVKQYIFYAIAAFFLYTMFSVASIKAGDYNERRERGTKMKMNISGINLLFGSFPNFTATDYDDGEVESVMTKNKFMREADKDRDEEGRDSRLIKTPWMFRTGYWVLFLSVIALGLLTYVYNQPHQKKYHHLAVCGGLLSSFAVIWVLSDFNRIFSKAQSLIGFAINDYNFHIGLSIGSWGLFLCFIFLFAEVVVNTFRKTSTQTF